MKNVTFLDLKKSFQNSIFTWEYFTDFKKAKGHVKKTEIELNLLNFLSLNPHFRRKFGLKPN